jgi:molybdate transport system substrate-binding protein
VIRGVAGAAVAVLLCAPAACGSAGAQDADGTQQLTVFAAASLTATFTELGERFEAAHEGVEVRLNFAGSSDLLAQLQQGAAADVFASADSRSMDQAVADGLVDGEPVDFAANTLEIAVPPDNPAQVSSVQDLARPGTAVVVCAPVVPCGAAAGKVERAAGVDIAPVSEEQSVLDVLNKVSTGQADAGLVYVTDVAAAGDRVTGIAFAESASAVNVYPIAALADRPATATARSFIDLVTSDTGRSVLTRAGFAKP